MSRFNSRVPRYDDGSDYTTNAPSYYDDLARKQKLIKELAKRIWDYEKTLEENLQMLKDKLKEIEDIIGEGFDLRIEELLREWVNDGTLEHIINEEIFNKKADKEWVDERLNKPIYYQDYTLTQHYDTVSETTYWITDIKMNDNTPIFFDVSNKSSGETVREYANRMETTLSINASTMKKDGARIYPEGVAIIDGKVIEDEATSYLWKVGITYSNKLVYFEPGDTSNEIKMKEPDIRSVLTAFTPLIIDGDQVGQDIWADGERHHYNDKTYPSQVIAQKANGDILFLTTGGRGFGGKGMDATDVVRILGGRDVSFAFMLDGGGSTSLVERGTKINPDIDNLGTKERKRPSFISIGSIDNRPLASDLKDAYGRISELEKEMDKIKNPPAELEDINNINNIVGTGVYVALKGAKGVPHDDVNLWFIYQFTIREQKTQLAIPYALNTPVRRNHTMYIRRINNNYETWASWIGFQENRRISSLNENTLAKDIPEGYFQNTVNNWNIWGKELDGHVETFNPLKTQSGYCKQFFYVKGSHHYYERHSNGDGNGWYEWFRFRGESETDA